MWLEAEPMLAAESFLERPYSRVNVEHHLRHSGPQIPFLPGNPLTKTLQQDSSQFKLFITKNTRYFLNPILLHPPVQGASAQAEGLGSLTHIATDASQRLADENTL